MKFLITVNLFFLTVICISAQNLENYNLIYSKTFLETSQKDFNKALSIADSLFSISETPTLKARSLMLSASLYKQSGEIKNAVDYALKAESIINGNDDVWLAKIDGFLASQYRSLGLLNKSLTYANKTIDVIKRINNPVIEKQLMGFVLQEKAYYEYGVANYQKSIAAIRKSQSYFDKNTQQNYDFLTANNEQLLGLNYTGLKDYDKALFYYNKALQKLNGMPDNFLKALVYNGFAQVYMGKKDLVKAKENLDLAEKISETSQYLDLKNEIYKTSKKYYLLKEDFKKLSEVTMKNDSVSERIENNSKSFINDSYNNLEKKNREVEKTAESKNSLIFIIGGLLIVMVVYFIMYRKYQKRKIDKINQAIKKLEINAKSFDPDYVTSKNENEDHIDENDPVAVTEIKDENSLMTEATEIMILKKLEKFEKSKQFIRNGISLPFLASYCNTNTKYLSYIINREKKKDFNNYINELRVLFIIEKVKNDPVYRKFKIATLAEEAGFSSQSKFSTAFKKVTDVSPSEFFRHFLQSIAKDSEIMSE
ncbi:MAG: AraC family transcriptional regulator [Chryseobacterium sp.]|uniref:helix-turn-helix domain-containing protein n=1 Tax=Chryseobacterium sp. TaxID=1871047 RepID=UPI000DB04ABD|nr:helix-turn-helix domain-containing protein [Chryseobacterium sp.]MPS63443.1 helix-turn-helix domain-containing protein [Chryseobacterium sp.]PZU19542.1 MAG: AraC family transcriptional regulator [Chryseobacterium sp.]